MQYKQTLQRCKATLFIILLWTVCYIADVLTGKGMSTFCGRGFSLIDGQYYRVFTAWLMHVNVWHLLANISGIFWAGFFLEPKVGSLKFGIFAAVASTLEELVYSGLLFRESQSSYGGSICVFALLGLLLATQLFKRDYPRFQLRTWYGNWLLGYAIIGNLPVFSFFTVGTLVTHGLSLAIGFLLALLAIVLKII